MANKLPRDLPGALRLVARGEIEFRRSVPCDAAHAWAAISQKEHMDRWFMKSEIDAREGGRFSFEGGWDGEIETFTAGEEIGFRADDGGLSAFRIESDDQGQVIVALRDVLPEDQQPAGPSDGLALRQPGGPGTHWVGLAAGWHDFMDGLANYLGADIARRSYDDLMVAYDGLLTRLHDGGHDGEERGDDG